MSAGATVEIFVPCRVFRVKTRMGPVEALSPIAELLIRAVHEGIVEFHKLSALFSLGDRVMLDLVFDLWRDGHLVIDTFRGLVALTAPTARLAASHRLDLAQPSGIREESREVMQERLTGMVLSTRHSAFLGDAGQDCRMDVVDFDDGVSQVRDDDLVAAVRDDLRRTDDRRVAEGDKVLSARLTRASLREAGKTMWLPLLVRVERDAELDEVQVDVLPSRPLSLTTRREMGRRLASFCERRPKSPFVQRLLSSAATRPVGAAAPEQAARELLGLAQACAAVAPDQRGEHHGRLDELADVVAGDVADRRGANADRAVIVTDEHDALLCDMLARAERQVVIVSPWIREAPVRSLYAALEGALERGVQVFLLWGIKRVAGDIDDRDKGDARLEDTVIRLLLSLHRTYPANFHFSKRSTATHAKLAVQDDRRALVTSYNLLSRPARSSAEELGVLLTATPRPQRCGVIERLLRWARDEYPEYAASRQIYVQAEDFTDDDDALRRSDAEELVWARPALPGDGTNLADDGELLASAVRVWQAGWVGLARRLGAALDGGQRQAVGLVTDGEHRLALRDALGTPCRRLVIASHRIGNEVIDKGFLDALDARLAEGTRVALLFTETTGVGRDAVVPLTELAARHPLGALRIVNEESHAKLVIVDNHVTVSSFNFLAFQGFYESLDGRGRRRQRTELGLALVDSQLADAVVARLNERFPALDIPREAAEVSRPGAGPARDDLVAISELAEAVAGVAADGDTGDAAAVIARSDRPAALLTEAERLDAPMALRRAMIARALQGSALSQNDRVHWTMRLVQDRIAEGDLVAAALLRAPHRDLPGLPERAIMLLAAGMDVAAIPATIDAAAALPAEHPDWQSLAVLGADRLAVHGDPEAEALVVASLDALQPGWCAAVTGIAEFWDRFHRALPLQKLSSVEAAREAAVGLDDAWRRLDAALANAERRVEGGAFLRADWAQAIHALVHSADEPIGRLRQASDRRSVAAVKAWVVSERRLDPSAHVDEAARRLGFHERLHRGARSTYLKDLREALRAAKDIARQDTIEAEHEDPAIMEEAVAVVESLAAGADGLRDEAALAEPAVAVVLELVLPRWLAFREGRA